MLMTFLLYISQNPFYTPSITSIIILRGFLILKACLKVLPNASLNVIYGLLVYNFEKVLIQIYKITRFH